MTPSYQRAAIRTLLISTSLMLGACDDTRQDWTAAEQLGTVEAFERFIELRPESPLSDSARTLIDVMVLIPRSELDPIWSQWDRIYGMDGSSGMFCARMDDGGLTTGMIFGTGNVTFDSNGTQVAPTRPGSQLFFETTGCVLEWINAIEIEANDRLTFTVTERGLMHESGAGRVVLPGGRTLEFQ